MGRLLGRVATTGAVDRLARTAVLRPSSLDRSNFGAQPGFVPAHPHLCAGQTRFETRAGPVPGRPFHALQVVVEQDVPGSVVHPLSHSRHARAAQGKQARRSFLVLVGLCPMEAVWEHGQAASRCSRRDDTCRRRSPGASGDWPNMVVSLGSRLSSTCAISGFKTQIHFDRLIKLILTTPRRKRRDCKFINKKGPYWGLDVKSPSATY